MIDRRLFLGGAGGALASLAIPRIAFAQAATERRFVFIIQRGAADGLSMVMPVGDSGFSATRGALAEDSEGASKLDSMFALHPALAETAKLYSAQEALFVHSVASPYRERSHFDGQNILETGGDAAYKLQDGWMNRLLGLLPAADSRAIAVSATVPVALRGRHDVSSYAPSALPNASGDLLARVGELYGADAQLHSLWTQAMRTREMAGDPGDGRNAAATGTLAARLLKGPQGARVALIETNGWDTHSGQRARLAFQLRGLDGMIAALKAGLGADWSSTLVLVATEFGRTVAPNGTGGTDHGTASAAILLGGAVKGGRVIADWPGLAVPALYEGRDLKPTLSLDSLIASALSQHYRLDLARISPALFPQTSRPRPIEGLLRA
jgi:uncharacterized protein (DUF1501 family)